MINQQNLNLVKGSQARQCLAATSDAAQRLTPLEELTSHRVTPETTLRPLEFLFTMNGTDCFPLSELVANTGKAKSGKTLFLSIVMACCLKPNVLGLQRQREKPIKVVWYDTEQSAQSTQQIILKRIIPLAGVEGTSALSHFNDQFFVFNVRGIGWEKRRELLAVAIDAYRPDLVIVDGVKDLLTDINDGSQATTVVEDLMGLAQFYNCCIVNVLHQNKSDTDRNMRGWIGTELTNKAFEVWSCAIVPKTDIFKVEHVMSRMKRSEKNLYYRLDDNALPCACDEPDEQPRELDGRFASKSKGENASGKKPGYKVDLPALNRDYILPSDDQEESWTPETVPWDVVKLFTDAMAGCTFLKFNQLMAIAMRISNIKDTRYYYHVLELAKQHHVLSPGQDAYNQQGFFLNSPEQRQRILDYEAQHRQQTPGQTAILFTENDEPVPY
jgi:hypothetical protein